MSKPLQKLRRYFGYLFPGAAVKEFIRYNYGHWRASDYSKAKNEVLLDLYFGHQSILAYSYFMNALARVHGARIISFSDGPRWPYRQFDRLYRSFNCREHVSVRLSQVLEKERDRLFEECRPKIISKRDLLELKVKDIWIGIDIYESYLRDFNRPTVDFDDPRLWKYVRKGIGILLFWDDYFTHHLVKGLAVSHGCFMRLNIPSKVAFKHAIPVYLPNVRGVVCADRPFAVDSIFTKFRDMFRRLPASEQARGIEWGKRQLDQRLGGVVGVDMPYSTKTSYHRDFSSKRILVESDRKKVLICTHCFYDNPHAYGRILFEDFYEWMSFLGDISERSNYDWYVKTHPDPLPGTAEIIAGIVARYPKLKVIPPETSHHQMVEEGIDFVLTVYGSVGHEYPAMGVQVVNAGYNPREAYDFNWHPKTVAEYEKMLLNLEGLKPKIEREDIYEFYFMNHKYALADALIYPSYAEFIGHSDGHDRGGPYALEYFMRHITPEKHNEILANLEKFIRSGKSHYLGYGPE